MKTRSDFTFKHNLDKGRHGWLRLTPAYSVKVVHQILDDYPNMKYILDPFSGTGTTGLVCGERGLRCDLLDINPFLVWFGRVKTVNYTAAQLADVRKCIPEVITGAQQKDRRDLWIPPINAIERWWSPEVQNLLARLYRAINHTSAEFETTKDLLLVAFCQCLIKWSNAAFNHQSVSFKQHQPSLFEGDQDDLLLDGFMKAVSLVVQTAEQNIKGLVNVVQADARFVPQPEGEPGLYDGVITSPPYPNRMSYIRELRPYMYWLGYLREAREAGELDWQAIGGTWGIATSRVAKWQPNGIHVDHLGFDTMIESIAAQNQLLANYVHKYFVDITTHLSTLYPLVAPGGTVFYTVGNSKFYETIVPVEAIFASLLNKIGFVEVNVSQLRKRNSKKELYEFIVSAKKPN